MEQISIRELYDINYSVEIMNALFQNWRERNEFSCIGKPKVNDMILYLEGCKAEYTLPSGKRFTAVSGDIVYCPTGSEYYVRFYDLESTESGTIGVNFSLFDQQGKNFTMSDTVAVFSATNANYRSMFYKLEHFSCAPIVCVGKLKSIMYDLIFHLSENSRREHLGRYSMIAKGIAYLEEDTEQLLKISEVAALCNISEAYFRRLFKSYCGMSPQSYRMIAKINAAKAYLRTDQYTVAEIADRLGFVDASYFIKQFRIQTGLTPLEYKKQYASEA